MDQQTEKDKTETVIGLGRRTREEIAKWNQMTALRVQSGGRHQTSPASLRGHSNQSFIQWNTAVCTGHYIIMLRILFNQKYQRAVLSAFGPTTILLIYLVFLWTMGDNEVAGWTRARFVYYRATASAVGRQKHRKCASNLRDITNTFIVVVILSLLLCFGLVFSFFFFFFWVLRLNVSGLSFCSSCSV